MRKISLNGLFCPKSLVFKQILRTMKITLFLLLFVTFQAYSHATYSQSTRISIPRSELRVGEILDKIEAQTEYLFVYNKKSVDVRRTVNVDADNQPVSEVLDEIFNGTDIRYVMEGKNIVLTKQNEKASEIIAAVQQENISVKGVVTDTKGEPIIGANVVEKGTTNGCITNIDGEFTLNTPTNATLVISFIGYQPVTIALNGQKILNVQMQEEALSLETVVVTAMGIKRKSSSLTYSVQQVGGDDLTRVKDANMINALEGKIAGVTINKSASGLGGSAKVSIRGIRSAFEGGNNQPLYVIDGVPMMNSAKETTSSVMGGNSDSGNRDSGDGISNLNPDDIQTISVLKGASAAALYGSQAANGVIMITTKKGNAGSTRITYSANVTFDQAISTPEFQNSYNSKWKKADLKDHDNVDDFFGTGVTAINSISLSTGNAKAQTYFSYANTTAKGIIEKNKLERHNLTFRETGKFFNDKLTLDGNVNVMRQVGRNRPVTGGLYMNPLVGLYTFPRDLDMTDYKSGEILDEARNMPKQNWYKDPETLQGMEGNPYWLVNRINTKDTRTRAIASLSATWEVTDWLKLQTRGTADYISDKSEEKTWASTSTTLTGGSWADQTDNGRYAYANGDDFMAYGDLMAMFNKTWGKFSLNAALGGSINYQKSNSLRIDSHTAGLYYPNVFTLTNIKYGSSTDMTVTNEARQVMQSVFATAQLGWNEALYLDLTARNDWSSTLYGTSKMDSGFFYPSVGVSWLAHNSFELPEWINFAKIRGSIAQVGNTLPLYKANQQPRIAIGGSINQVTDYNDGNLKPEISTSYEAGFEMKFFHNRFDIDFTWYKTLTKNQFLLVPMLPGSAYKNQMINAGKISNKGIELTVGGIPVQNENFRWRTQVNFSTNKNKVEKLADNYKVFAYGSGVNMAYRMIVKEGGSLGDLYGNSFKRDEGGKIVLDAEGLPELNTDRQQYLGNSQPKCTLGWSNTFSFYGVSVNFLIDARIGGDVMSFTQGQLDAHGVSKAAGEAMDRGYVEVEGQKFTNEEKKNNVQGFYARVGDINGCTEYYMYKGTNIRLRELSVSYSLPEKWMEKTKVFKDINLSLVARNLFFFYKDAPFDPDALMSVGNDMQGVDVFGMPTTRSIGFNVKFTF